MTSVFASEAKKRLEARMVVGRQEMDGNGTKVDQIKDPKLPPNHRSYPGLYGVGANWHSLDTG